MATAHTYVCIYIFKIARSKARFIGRLSGGKIYKKFAEDAN